MFPKYPEQEQFGFLENPITHISLENKEGFEFQNAAALSNDKKFLITTFVSEDHFWLNIWDLQKRTSLRKIKAEYSMSYFKSLQFSSDNKFLIYTLHQDNEIIFLNLETRKIRNKIRMRKNDFQSMLPSQKLKRRCRNKQQQSSLTTWKMGDSQSYTLDYNFVFINFLFYNFDRFMIIISVEHYKCTQYFIWNLKTSKSIKKWQGKFISPVCELQIKDETNLLIIVFLDNQQNQIQIWSLSTFSVIRTLSQVIQKLNIKSMLGMKIIAQSEYDEIEGEDGMKKINENLQQDGKQILEAFDIVSFKTQKLTSRINLGEIYRILPNGIITGIIKNNKMNEIHVFF